MLIWLDLETTGLSPTNDRILEIGVIVTDDQFVPVAQWSAIAHAPESAKLTAHPKVQEMHTVNGLWSECFAAPIGQTLIAIEGELMQFLADLGIEPKTAQLAGSTISFDRAFVDAQMPLLSEFLHYRNLDVTTLNEIARRVWPKLHATRPQLAAGAHRAMADIDCSLRCLRHYADFLTEAINDTGWLAA